MPPRLLGRGLVTFGGSHWNLSSMTGTSSDVPVPFPGARYSTMGPTNQGLAAIWVSHYANGYGKNMTVRLKRNGVTLSSRTWNGMSDSTAGWDYMAYFPIPAYSRAALYELWWSSIDAGTSYSYGRYMTIPTDQLRLETREVFGYGSGQVPIGDPNGQDILRVHTAGPTRRGTARLVWSIQAAGISKNPTAMYLYRDSTLLYSSGNLNPGDSTDGTAYDSGVLALPPWPRAATYRWVGAYQGRAHEPTDMGNVSFYVSNGSIVVPLVRNR